MTYPRFIEKKLLSREKKIILLSATDPKQIEDIRREAYNVLIQTCGSDVYYRGLIEFSNNCANDCLYCGIRRSNHDLKRYILSTDDIVKAAIWCAEQGYGSVVLQSGERRDNAFIDKIVDAVSRIKAETQTAILPEGLGITLCAGEQEQETYQRFFESGAHRYLLRVETSNKAIFEQIHPPDQSFEHRIHCLRLLRDTGFQVGTGVMIGLPGQTIQDLADDIAFFETEDVDMIGMGPFIPNPSRPLNSKPCPDASERMRLSLLMIAVTRLAMPDINIAATTALQTLDPTGREKGLDFGANVLMPLLTPMGVRNDYLLYPGKPCLDESAEQCRICLEKRISAVGRRIGYNQWGDSRHALTRKALLDKP